MARLTLHLILSVAFILPGLSLQAGDLARVMRLDEVTEILSEEGRSMAAELDQDSLGGGGGADWTRRIAEIYDPVLMRQVIETELEEGLTGEARDVVIGFFESERGQRIITLENSARQAISNPDVEAIARQSYRELQNTDDRLLAQVREFVGVNDLLERNVAGAMSSDYYFTRGLVDGSALDLSESELLSEIWSGEDEVRRDTEEWLFGFLLMAYQPLSQADMAEYVAFSHSPAGKALNAALFMGFEKLYANISYRLGVEMARQMHESEL